MERFQKIVVRLGKGKVVIKTGDTEVVIKETAAPRLGTDRKEGTPTKEIDILEPLVRQAFPEEGGMGSEDETAYFPLREAGSIEELHHACARLAKKGWSALDVATIIVGRSPQVKINCSFGDMKNDQVIDSINRLASFLSIYYPGNQTLARRNRER